MDTVRLTRVATTCTEDGHIQTAKIAYNMYRGWKQTDCQKWLQHVQWIDRPTAKSVYNMYRGWTD